VQLFVSVKSGGGATPGSTLYRPELQYRGDPGGERERAE
jgi:hypothetical protein